MKSLTLTLLFLGLFSGLSAQFVTIPDANFRNELVLRYPDCFDANMDLDTTCIDIVRETHLSINAAGISNFEGVKYFDSLQNFECWLNQLTSLPELPSSLKELNCYQNNLTGLSTLPSGLQRLNCFQNQLSALPALPSSLVSLMVYDNRLSILPALPDSLKSLYCTNNQLTNLPALPSGLKDLNCGNNPLTNLPALPDSLQALWCFSNQLTRTPALPNGLRAFICFDNQFTSLPALPNGLGYLYCSSNPLNSLPSLPDSLRTLYCENNQLISLPALPGSLQELSCSNNQLTSLPALPSTLQRLECFNNQLTSLPALPSRLSRLYCGNNRSLSCLPLLPISLSVLDFSGTRVRCIPNYTQFITQTSTSTPLCTNSNQICQVNPMASGVVYSDSNNNGIRDTLENQIGGIPITVSPNNWTNISDTTNGYLVKLDTMPTINTITPGYAYPYRTFTPSSFSVTATNLGLLPTSYNFAMSTQPNVTDLVTRVSTWFIRPGFQTLASINVENIGTINQTNASISLEIPNGLTVITVTPANGVVTGNTVTWSGESIAIFERKNYSVTLQVPATMSLGTSLTYTAIATPATTDFTPADNIANETVVVRGSYDPNDKQVNKDRLPNNYVATDEEMLYTIRFQNTGTDTAFTVLVRDTLDLAKLDFSTFRVTGASHALRTNVRDHGVLEFVFNNINLPDSFVNEPLSHGYVQFRIHPKANLPLGTQIKNRAFIYFDFNTPIITNFATTTVGLLSVNSAELGAGSLSLYPVPVAEQLTVNFNAVRSGEVRYRLLDLQGRLLQEQQLSVIEGENISTMDMSKLGAGMYLLQVVGEQGSVSQKIIKE